MTNQMEERRAQQHQVWETFAPGWGKWEGTLSKWLRPAADQMIAGLELAASSRHLDVACGTGEPGLTIAERMPERRVVLTDFSARMVAIARNLAAERGLSNVEVMECGAEDLPFEDASFDSASCRFGLMFVPDDHAAARELHRVLKPGGRAALAVWAQPDRNPWAAMTMKIIMDTMQLTPPPPDAPGIFRHGAEGSAEAVLQAAGFGDVESRELEVVQEVASPDEAWVMLTEIAAPIASAMATATPEQRATIESRVKEGYAGFSHGGKVRMPGVARCIVARA